MTTKGAMTKQCPSITELLEGSPEVREHLVGCWRCQAVVRLQAPDHPQLSTDAPQEFESAPLPQREPLKERAPSELVVIDNGEGMTRERLIAVVLALIDDGTEL